MSLSNSLACSSRWPFLSTDASSPSACLWVDSSAGRSWLLTLRQQAREPPRVLARNARVAHRDVVIRDGREEEHLVLVRRYRYYVEVAALDHVEDLPEAREGLGVPVPALRGVDRLNQVLVRLRMLPPSCVVKSVRVLDERTEKFPVSRGQDDVARLFP